MIYDENAYQSDRSCRVFKIDNCFASAKTQDVSYEIQLYYCIVLYPCWCIEVFDNLSHRI